MLLSLGLPLACAAQVTAPGCHEALRRADYSAALRLGREVGGYEGLMCAGRAQLASADYAGAAMTFAEIEKTAGEPFQQMVALIFQARSAKGLKNPVEALRLYERSLAIARSLGEKQAIMIALNESGLILQAGGDTKGALDRFHEAYKNAANDNERAECHHLIASAYSVLGDHDKAIEHQLKSVVLEERSGDLEHYLAARMALAEVSIRAGDLARAQREIDESLPIARENASPYWEAKILLQSVRLEQARGNTDRARLQAQQARAAVRKSGDAELLKAIEAVGTDGAP